MPLFVKPANLGSSVGISSHQARQFSAALKEAFRYDNKIVIEEFIAAAIEVPCSATRPHRFTTRRDRRQPDFIL
jgi:D-alanine-D-alanine ligase